MKNGIMRNLAAQLAENGKLVANGARRTNAEINELSRAVYSTCDLCKAHPDQAPLWQLRARSAVQDLEDKRIEYRDVVLDIYGVPVFWLPYLTHADPSAKRASGFLVPSAGASSHLGAFLSTPYYWAIDPQSDAVITPTITAQNGPALDTVYRRRFNDGQIKINGSLAYDDNAAQAAIFATGQFAINDEWRWGFDINQATSSTYVRDYNLNPSVDLLSSQLYLEGFGQGAYSRLDTRFYQGLNSDVTASELPYVLPRYQYSFFGQPDALGGRLSLDAGAFNVLRSVGTNTERANLSMNWERPATGAIGDLWKLTLHADSAVYATRQLDQQPSWGPGNTSSTAQGLPTAALEMRWPLTRDAGGWGSQLIEPIVQVIGAPYASSYPVATNPTGTKFVNSLIPNEDSLGYEFTDANLFSLNRFSGIDRLEGGPRAAVALHGAWFWPNGGLVDTQIGQSYRLHKDSAFPTGSGLEDTVSDVVGHVTVSPTPYLDLTTRARFDHQSWQPRFVDALASTGPAWLRVNAGYLYSSYSVFDYYDVPPTGTLIGTPPRNEVSLGVNTVYDRYRLGAYARRDVATGQMVSTGFRGTYEDECFVFTGTFDRRFTSVDGDNGATTVLFQITLKTVGSFGFHAF
jgi:LPS-assembly protein